MRFNGRLQTDADPHGWLKSELAITGSKVELSAGDELLGSWPVGQVRAERVEGDRFELQLGDDRAVFAADDALAFSYEALPKLTRKPLAEAASGFRKLLGGGRKASPAAPEPVAVLEAPDVEEPTIEETDEIPANVRRLRELIEVAKANRPDEPSADDSASEGEDEVDEAKEPPAPDSESDEFVLTDSVIDDEHEPGPLWSMPEPPFKKPSPLSEHPKPVKPVALTIVDPPAVDLATAFNDDTALADEIDRLSQHISRKHLSSAQNQAAISLLRALRNLLVG
jgi:hypothetical protein